MKNIHLPFLALILFITSCRQQNAEVKPAAIEVPAAALASWADAPRQRIETWVREVTDTASARYIPPADRIAVFDNDGTLWPEQPLPNQALFAIDRLRQMAISNSAWQKDPSLQPILSSGAAGLAKAGKKGLAKMMALTHADLSAEDFAASVKAWLDTARDGKFRQPYNKVVYLPMVELLEYLRAHGFKTFIVSGGGADFMRVWAEDAYGIPPYQVVGSYTGAAFQRDSTRTQVIKKGEDLFFDDKEAKPVAIHRFIGKRPVFCGGNSDGDQAMMQYTAGSPYHSLNVLVHHTDSVREYKYDLKTVSGHLETALVEARNRNWLVVDMARDWKKVFAFEK